VGKTKPLIFNRIENFLGRTKPNLSLDSHGGRAWPSRTPGPPNGTCCTANNPNFGVVTSTIAKAPARLIPLGLKFSSCKCGNIPDQVFYLLGFFLPSGSSSPNTGGTELGCVALARLIYNPLRLCAR
jgi:hypothetical protein